MIGLLRKLWRVLRIHGVWGKLLNGIKTMYVNHPAYVKAKVDELVIVV